MWIVKNCLAHASLVRDVCKITKQENAIFVKQLIENKGNDITYNHYHVHIS